MIRLSHRTALLALVVAAHACTPEQPEPPPAVAPTSSPAPPAVLFADQPFRVEALRLTVGRELAPREIDLRATLRVLEPHDDAIEMKARIACETGDHRIVTVSEMITPAGAALRLRKPRSEEIYLRSPSTIGPVRAPRQCGIELHARPRKAKTAPALVEHACWESGTVRAGPCELSALTAPPTPVALHGIEGRFDGELVVDGWLQTRDAFAPRGLLQARADCADASDQDMSTISLDGFTLAAGESTAFGLRFFGEPPRLDGACTLRFAWQEVVTDDAAKAVVELGTWCAKDNRTTPGPCA